MILRANCICCVSLRYVNDHCPRKAPNKYPGIHLSSIALSPVAARNSAGPGQYKLMPHPMPKMDAPKISLRSMTLFVGIRNWGSFSSSLDGQMEMGVSRANGRLSIPYPFTNSYEIVLMTNAPPNTVMRVGSQSPFWMPNTTSKNPYNLDRSTMLLIAKPAANMEPDTAAIEHLLMLFFVLDSLLSLPLFVLFMVRAVAIMVGTTKSDVKKKPSEVEARSSAVP
mmetsp:Transcript_13122/g.37905  ORF Transcript_13122/g.37905 Transcript_13122/m.37905 type:complete len:224 (-) Transcript_13122:2224-2895(-)